MRAISGVFTSSSDAANAAERLISLLGGEHVNFLTPGPVGEKAEDVPTTEDMPPVGAAIGGVVAGALGVATTFAIPGIGQVAAVGAAAAAFLAGAAIGWKLGDAADRVSSTGLPIDELYIYEDALRQGRSVVIAMVDEKDDEDVVREILESAGAESLDAARQRWWTGLRDAEAEHYESPAVSFPVDEDAFRKGFEAALAPWARGREFDDAIDFLRTRHARDYQKPAYRYGFERGQAYVTDFEKVPGRHPINEETGMQR